MISSIQNAHPVSTPLPPTHAIQSSPYLSRVWRVIRLPFEKASEWCAVNRVGELAGKLWDVCKTISKTVNEIWGAVIKGTIPSEANSNFLSKAVKWLNETKGVHESFKWLRLASISSVAFIAIALFTHGYHFVVGSVDRKIDAGLKMMSDLSDLGASISAFFWGLAEGGMILKTSIAWLPVLNIASAALSLGTLGLSTKKYIQNSQVLKEIQKDEKNAFGRYVKGDPDLLRKDFQIEGPKLQACLQKIAKVGDEAKEKQAIHNLKVRLSDSIFTDKLAIVASVVSVIGLGILLISPLAPFVIAGFGLLAISAAIGSGALIYHLVSKYKFEKTMNL